MKSLLLIVCFNLVFFPDAVFAKSDKASKKEEQKKELDKKTEKKSKKVEESRRALWLAHVLREREPQKQIEELGVKGDKLPVFLVPSQPTFKPLVKLEFVYPKVGWTLFDAEGQPLPSSGVENEYLLYAYLRSRISTVELKAVGPNEKEQKEIVYLFAPEAREFKSRSLFDSILFVFGHTYMVYRQETFGTFVSQSALIGARYYSPEKGNRFGLLGDIYSTIYTYDSSPIDRNTHFLEARLAGTYAVKIFKNPKARSRVSLGASTINLFGFGSEFGFSGLFGPNIGLKTEYFRDSRDSIRAEIQYALYDDDPLEERSVKLSLDWNRNLSNLRRAQVGISYSNHKFTSDSDEVSADLTSVYFSLSF